MKKLTFIFALLCASVMSWGTKYCHTEISSTNNNGTVYMSCCPTGNPNEYVILFEGTNSYPLKTKNAQSVGFNDINGKAGASTLDFTFSSEGNGYAYATFTSESTPDAPYVAYIVFGTDNGELMLNEFPHDMDWTACDVTIPTPASTPVTQYCRFATGHGGNPEHGDVNGRILLTIRKISDTSVKVKIEPNNNGNDYFDVMKVILNGASQEIGTPGGPALSDMEFTFTGLSSLSFTVNVLWHNHNWADVNGRWSTGDISVTEAGLCTEETTLTVGSEYCCYYGDETKSDSHYAALSWETNADGDVVITIGEGPGEHNTAFRSNGLGDNLDGFHVLSGDGFATDEEASTYFTRVYGGAGSKTYTLRKKGGVTLPSPAKIRFYGKPFEWLCDENDNAYTNNKTFVYTYGTICNQLDAPTNVAVSTDSVITFDAVVGATKYTAFVYLAGVEKYRQEVASGDVLHFWPYVDGDYHVNIVAWGTGKTESEPSTDYVWSLEERAVVLGNSEYCEHIMQSGTNTEAAFTWETDGSGNIVITISETLGGAADASHFRANALALGNFKVGAGQAAGSNYFSHPGTTTGNQLILTATNAPALGEKIYYHGVVEYATSQNGDAWPTLDFEWTYGTVCSGKAVSATPNNSTMGSAVVQKAGVDVTNVDEGDEVSFIATVADAELYRFVNWTKGGVEVSTNATYVTTITETTNLIANFDYIRNTYCHYEVLATGGAAVGKKLYMTIGSIGGGMYQIKYEGSAEAPLLALNNANYMVNNVSTDIDYTDPDTGNPDKKSGGDVPFSKKNGRWSFNAAGYGMAKMEFSLAEGKTIDDIYVWGNNIAFNTSLGELIYEDNNSEGRLHLFGMNASKRHNIDWNATCSDAEAPAFDKAEAEILNESSVRLTIQASDNWEGLLTYTIARSGAEPIISNHASGEEFTQDVDGLTAGTEYTFTVTVSDGVNNVSQNIVVTPVGDSEKPVMGEASLESKTWHSAIINVAATDNKGVAAYYVVEKDADYIATDGKITIEGLIANTNYTLHIKAKDAAGNISDNSAEVVFTTDAHSLVPTTAAPIPTWPAEQVKSLYSDTYELAPANVATYNAGWWSAPAITLGEIDGNHYMDYNLANDGMIGWQYDQISVATMEKLHIDIYASAAGTVSIRPITDGDGALNDNRKSLTLVAQQWNSFDIDLTEFGAHDWTKLFQFSIEYWAAGGLLGEHISVDNVYFYRTTELIDNEKPTNVSANVAKASFGSITLNVSGEDNQGTVLFSIKIGDTEYAQGAAASGASKAFTLSGLTQGTDYSITVIASDESGNEADPVIVAAQTNAIAAAPVPTHNAAFVRSVYCDAYETALAHDFLKNTWTGIPYSELDLGGDHVLAYTNPNMPNQMPDVAWGENSDGGNAIIAKDGFNDGTNKGLDVRNMQYIHFDIWSSVATTYPELRLNDTPAGSIVLDGSGWQSFDLDITSLTDAQKSNIRWIKFIAFRDPAPEDIVIDNVYFWSYGVTPNAAQGNDAGGWATFAAPIKLAVPDGLTAYKASYERTETEEILNLSPISVIPAGAGVILKGTAGEDYLFAPSNASDPDMSGNVLVGCVERTDVSAVRAEKDIFCMRYSSSYDMTGFFLYEGQYVPAGRAYLPLDKESNTSGAPRRVRFVINESQTTTAIENAHTDSVDVVKFIENGQLFIRRGEAVYNLQGVRVK